MFLLADSVSGARGACRSRAERASVWPRLAASLAWPAWQRSQPVPQLVTMRPVAVTALRGHRRVVEWPRRVQQAAATPEMMREPADSTTDVEVGELNPARLVAATG
jgi:hypothetical protein